MKLMKKAIRDYNFVDCIIASVLALIVGVVPIVGGVIFLGVKEKLEEKRAKKK